MANRHPTAVFVRRNDRKSAPTTFTDERTSIRRAVHVNVETAPTPPQDTLFAEVGKGRLHGKPYMWRFNSLNIAAIQSIMYGSGGNAGFAVPRSLSPVIVGMPRGVFEPAVERVNIDRPKQTTRGAQSTVQPGLVVAPQYLKLV